MESNLKIEEERIETISNRVIRTFQKRSDFIPSLKIKFFISKSNRLAESNSKERRIETISKGMIHIVKIYSYIYIYICTRKKSCEKYGIEERKRKRREIFRSEYKKREFIQGNSFFRNGQMLKRSNA